MKQIQAYDENGEAINNLVQWDQGITIYLKDEQINKAYPVHFQSGSKDTAYVVNSTYTDEYTISATVPNAALRVAFPITGYVYLETDDTMQSILMFRIGVIARAEPDDLVYEDDEEYYTISQLITTYGKSAYDYAVEGGYTGTEEEFIEIIANINTVYGYAVDAGYTGTEEEFAAEMANLKTTYEYAEEAGYSNDEDSFKAALASIMQMETGYFEATSLSADATCVGVIAFENTYTSTPIVVPVVETIQDTSQLSATISTWVAAITTTGCTIYTHTDTDLVDYVIYRWLVIGI